MKFAVVRSFASACALVLVGAPAAVSAQGAGTPVAPAVRVSMDESVRLALERNRSLRAQRLNVDLAKADEITAGLKANPSFSSTVENFPLFAPGQLTWDFLKNQIA